MNNCLDFWHYNKFHVQLKTKNLHDDDNNNNKLLKNK